MRSSSTIAVFAIAVILRSSSALAQTTPQWVPCANIPLSLCTNVNVGVGPLATGGYLLGNTSSNINDGYTGTSARSIGWQTSDPGYAFGLQNAQEGYMSNGLLVKTSALSTAALRIVSGADANGIPFTRFLVTGGGHVGIGMLAADAPSSPFEIRSPGLGNVTNVLNHNGSSIFRVYEDESSTGFLSLFSPTETVRLSSAGSSWLNGGYVGIGTFALATVGTPSRMVVQSETALGVRRGQIDLIDTSSLASPGGVMNFGGIPDPAVPSTPTTWAAIGGFKENATPGNLAGYLALSTRPTASPFDLERVRITSDGNVGIGTVPSPACVWT